LRHPYLQSKITLFANYQTVELLRPQKPLKTGRNLITYLGKSYDLLLEFDALDRANIRSEFKGFIFRRK